MTPAFTRHTSSPSYAQSVMATLQLSTTQLLKRLNVVHNEVKPIVKHLQFLKAKATNLTIRKTNGSSKQQDYIMDMKNNK